MAVDAQGLAITAASAEAVTAYDDVVEAYLKYRADAGQRLKGLMKLDPEMPMGLVLGGVFFMLAYNTALVPRAKAAAEAAARHAGTDRERAHAAALALWADGQVDAALGAWEAIMAVHPHDILAFRLHHFCAFWLGRAGQMLRAVDAVAGGADFLHLLATGFDVGRKGGSGGDERRREGESAKGHHHLLAVETGVKA